MEDHRGRKRAHEGLPRGSELPFNTAEWTKLADDAKSREFPTGLHRGRVSGPTWYVSHFSHEPLSSQDT